MGFTFRGAWGEGTPHYIYNKGYPSLYGTPPLIISLYQLTMDKGGVCIFNKVS